MHEQESEKPERIGGTFGRGTSKPKPGAPIIYVYGKRVTEADVIQSLRDLGDRALEDYQKGRLPVEEAYRMAAIWKRNLMEFNR